MSAAPSDLDRWIAAKRPIEFRHASSPFAEFDLLGRKQPHRLGLPSYLLLIARLDPARVRRVPSSAITEEGQDETGEFSFVGCPCGAHPVAAAEMVKCSGCERYYVEFERGAVYVVYGAMEPPPLPGGAAD